MIVINERVTLSGENKNIEFDLEDLPEGKYRVCLTITNDNDTIIGEDFNLENWSSGIKQYPLPTFRRVDMY